MKGHTKLTIHIVQHLAPGGIETLALNMLRFCPSDEQVLIVSLESTYEQGIKRWPLLSQFKSHLIFLDKPEGFSTSTLIQLSKLFFKYRPQVVHTHHIGPLIYAGSAARIVNIPHHIHTEHDAWHLANPNHQKLQKMALKIAKPHLVADAELVRQQIHHFIGDHEVTVIQNGIDCETFCPGSRTLARYALNLPERAFIVGNAGRQEIVKGQDILIKAMLLLPNHVHLALAGDGSQHACLVNQAEALGLSHRVHFLGHIDNVVKFYQSLDVFCLSSRNEGFPLATLEAQSCDIVTIAGNVGAVNETLSPSASHLVSHLEAEEFATAIYNEMQTPSQTSPRHFVKQNNDIRQMIQAYRHLTQPMESLL